jgi:hypothetical protein
MRAESSFLAILRVYLDLVKTLVRIKGGEVCFTGELR